MANKTFETKLAIVNKTTAEWASEVTIPVKGCSCVEWTNSGKPKMKIGDGVNAWADLNYVSDDITAKAITDALGYTPADKSKLGVADGIATLDAGGKVPEAQLPSYVDDVIEINTLADAPSTGEKGKIYVTIDTNKCYRWSGTMYVEIQSRAQADWNETDDTSPSFIKNKPTIPSGVIVDDALSDTSTNAVQNKVVKAALDGKLNLTDTLVLNCVL